MLFTITWFGSSTRPGTTAPEQLASYYELLANTPRGFAIGWEYAIGWLTVLPFELTAAGITIRYWRDDIDIGVWITVFFVALCIIQVFGVRGYGESKLQFEKC